MRDGRHHVREGDPRPPAANFNFNARGESATTPFFRMPASAKIKKSDRALNLFASFLVIPRYGIHSIGC
jgi:hypothetical protein